MRASRDGSRAPALKSAPALPILIKTNPVHAHAHARTPHSPCRRPRSRGSPRLRQGPRRPTTRRRDRGRAGRRPDGTSRTRAPHTDRAARARLDRRGRHGAHDHTRDRRRRGHGHADVGRDQCGRRDHRRVDARTCRHVAVTAGLGGGFGTGHGQRDWSRTHASRGRAGQRSVGARGHGPADADRGAHPRQRERAARRDPRRLPSDGRRRVVHAADGDDERDR